MPRSDAPVKTAPPPNDREDRPRASGDIPVVVNEVEARQGVTGHNVRYVLGFGLAGVIIAFAVILFFDFFLFR